MVDRQEKKRIRKTTQEATGHDWSIELVRAWAVSQGYRRLNIIVQDADTGEQVGFIPTARKQETVAQLIEDIREDAALPSGLWEEITHKSAAGEKNVQYWLKGRGEGGRLPGKSGKAQKKRLELAQDYWDTIAEYRERGERIPNYREFTDDRGISASYLKTALKEYAELRTGKTP